ncbi:MAG: efflux RND transporter periplasmic adaptor subunit [Gallionella sp.]|nr:HlyD family efflux transporter periplasmic adaptor subunit [Gallionella sp.]
MQQISRMLGLIALFITQFVWASGEITMNAKQIQALGISVAALSGKQSGEVSGLPSQIVVPSNQLFVISTPLAALVEQTMVGVGDNVKRGQPIARLQSPALAEAQRGLLQATVQNQLAKENSSRDEALWKDGIIAESRYRISKGAATEAQAVLAERKQILRLSGMSDAAIGQLQSGNSLSSTLTINSPIDGVVLEKFASAGQRLDAAIPLFKIAKLNPLGLEIQAPLTMTTGLKIGAAINIPGLNASGKLTAIGRSLTGSNQTILLRGIITKGAENLRPNQVVESSITTSSKGGTQWEIPKEAIARINNKAIVFVATTSGFRSQPVEILSEGAQSSVISGSLKGDEQIAVRGVSALKSSAMGLGGGE